MSGFRFRAQAALDLRRREDDEAQGVLARAEAGLRAAMQALAEAQERAEAARTQWAVMVQQPGGLSQHLWYRSWIVRLDGESAAARTVATAREAERARAQAARVRTHQRAEALAKFREKSERAWHERLAAEEQKHLDALATIRFVTAGRTRANG